METAEEDPERSSSEKKTVLNLSKRDLTKTEYSFLGKGLKFLPKTKHHYVIQLKQDVFEFTRKLRLKDFFADKDKDSDDDDDDDDRNDENSRDNLRKFPKERKSTFIPPADSTFHFYINAITHKTLQKSQEVQI